ncbi:hypothetical protein D3C72_2498580 [compost metagenome]
MDEHVLQCRLRPPDQQARVAGPGAQSLVQGRAAAAADMQPGAEGGDHLDAGAVPQRRRDTPEVRPTHPS